ncbi:hypothetical protein L1987_60337 [Smallanthus sonchifolius]|uniref:Uncharacterized protein n=1 Tax=Smallanthus sonchifolius TaxID=185202 RepID=A0ACB9D803_9ASTR|nr:hypothetical protein L1987_60337 [Smallanthus sonchifolius]
MIEASLFFCFLLTFLFIFLKSFTTKSDPFTVNYLSLHTNRHRLIEWTSDVVNSSPTLTIAISRPFSLNRIITANPAVVHHILKTKFSTYPKGDMIRSNLFDLLGEGIFNVDGDEWKFQRQICSHEFNTKSLKHFVEHVVDVELNERLLPILTAAAAQHLVLDLQDILQRFAFDNISRIAFGYDPAYLTSSFPNPKFAVAFEDAVRISTERNLAIESEIVKEIKEKSDSPVYDEVKDMCYTHASLCESMRLYLPVPVDSKKGMMVEKVWGGDWKEFRPERWLEKDERTEKVRVAAKDSYAYPVFQAGPRICLGKDMAFLQMKKVVAGVLGRFKVVPAVGDGGEPVLEMGLTMRMKDGFPVRIEERK